MSARIIRFAAVVLAAGAGARYSSEPGAKLLAVLDDRPVLDHVLVSLRRYVPMMTIVVLGHGAERIERTIAWDGERRVHNPHPERGLGSSLKVGMEALQPHADELEGAFIVLGDQPRLRTDVLRALAAVASDSRPGDRPLIVPHYADDAGPRNPVLLLRPAWPLIGELDDEHGLGPLIDQHPASVQTVGVAGAMPDVDTPADLHELRASP